MLLKKIPPILISHILMYHLLVSVRIPFGPDASLSQGDSISIRMTIHLFVSNQQHRMKLLELNNKCCPRTYHAFDISTYIGVTRVGIYTNSLRTESQFP